MVRRYRRVKTSEIKRLRQMAEIGTVSAEEASRALGRHSGFANRFARELGLKFANGSTALKWRLIMHRKS